MTDQVSDIGARFRRDGYAVLDLDSPEAVTRAADDICVQLERLTGVSGLDLAKYHELQLDEDTHETVLIELTRWFRANRVAQDILEKNISSISRIAGSDIRIERNPFIRLNRPNMSHDNLGLHRDTFYGGSAYEMSVIIPFVDLPDGATLEVIPGSHNIREDELRIKDAKPRGTHVERGSAIHKAGFPYAPKIVDEDGLGAPVSVPLRVGQALVFTLACIHGSKMNRSPVTRVSTDCRVTDPLSSVDRMVVIDGVETPYYEDPVIISPLNAVGREFDSRALRQS